MGEKLLELAAQFGPFPFGVIVGILIMMWTTHKLTGYLERQVKALQDENKQNIKTILTQQERINELHLILPDMKKN